MSRKKARKVDKKEGYARQRKDLEQFLAAEVEMRDLDGKAGIKEDGAGTGKGDAEMEVD